MTERIVLINVDYSFMFHAGEEIFTKRLLQTRIATPLHY